MFEPTRRDSRHRGKRRIYSQIQTMKPKLLHGLALVLSGILLTFDLSARITRTWTENELKNTSDLVVVCTVTAVKDLDETNTLGDYTEKFHGVETAFKVSHVLKGSFTNDEIVLHHYRYENDSLRPGNAPDFIQFYPFYTNEYVLYLVHDGTNRYAPVTGQFDAALSVKKPKASKNGYLERICQK